MWKLQEVLEVQRTWGPWEVCEAPEVRAGLAAREAQGVRVPHERVGTQGIRELRSVAEAQCVRAFRLWAVA